MTQLDTLLASLAREHSTGALRIGRNGTVYLDDGRVTYMECAHTPGVERLLATRGLMSETKLRALQAEGGCERLLADGPVTAGELQYAVLSVVLDAAFFLLPATGSRPKFRPGERHWLGGQWFFDVAGLVRECARRRAQLAQTWPSADVDTLPVRPSPRLPGHGVTLSRIQWEVVVRSDGKATPMELAKQIGRPCYPVLLAVRRLAAAGLLEPPEPSRPPPAERRTGTGRKTTAVAAEPEAAEGGLPKRTARQAATARPPHDPEAAPAQSLGPPVTGDPTDLALLMRLKKALEELS
ncbi:transcriptional regulator [Nonomuraea terrae]|uniref:Transcriptional regulator n=1 Tax=Nonomuraea terrae TaxID=2530383 RepID=A0A4R4YDV5_9ACTN|nr:transcriptional regulator [Nonomuraea terrae]TDD42865.1 transcriptional regulator [Nonomuraea terrae]